MKLKNIILLGILTLCGVQSRINQYSLDQKKILSEIETIKHSKDIKYKRNLIENFKNSKFEYDVHCLNKYKDMCEVIKDELANALDDIANTLEIYKPITFKAYITKDDKDKSIAYATDINFVPIKTSNDSKTPAYLYTQALAKQLNLNTKHSFYSTDFNLVINLSEKTKDLIENKDHLRIKENIIHELIHALGFAYYNSLIKIKSEGYLEYFNGIATSEDKEKIKFLPNPMAYYDIEKIKKAETYEELDHIRSKGEILALSPITIFEKNLVDIHSKKNIFEGLGFLYKEFNCFNKEVLLDRDLSSYEYKKCYKQLSEDTKERISKVVEYYYLKYKSMGILTKKGTVVPVQTFDDLYWPGSSIEHVNALYLDEFFESVRKSSSAKEAYLKNENSVIEYNDVVTDKSIEKKIDSNFIMYYLDSKIDMKHFLKTVAKNNKYGLIGQDIVDILTTIGWTEKGKSKNNEKYYISEDIKIPEMNDFKITLRNFEIELEKTSDKDEIDEDNLIENPDDKKENDEKEDDETKEDKKEDEKKEDKKEDEKKEDEKKEDEKKENEKKEDEKKESEKKKDNKKEKIETKNKNDEDEETESKDNLIANSNEKKEEDKKESKNRNNDKKKHNKDNKKSSNKKSKTNGKKKKVCIVKSRFSNDL